MKKKHNLLASFISIWQNANTVTKEIIMTSKWTSDHIPDQTGRTVVVTGANSGIGYEMARALAHKNATVILACRNPDNGEAAVRQINQEYPQTQAQFIHLDLTDLSSIRRFSDDFTLHHDRLDILINNAGIMRTPFGKTADGFELQFGTNHLGHFALTGLLLSILDHTAQARVITMSSGGERFGKIDFENLNAEKAYDAAGAYSQSKIANLLFTYELQRRFEDANMDALAAAAHPGWTVTNLQVHWPMLRILNPFIGQEPTMGSLPGLYAATGPDVKGGDYYGPNGWFELRGSPTKVQSSDLSHDRTIAARLWKVSEELTGVKYSWTTG
jgi:NAD(P)-dependent dehydrogenase (short-subunit alcohol dehydrogenase family)